MASCTARRELANFISASARCYQLATKLLRAFAFPSQAAGWCLADSHTGGASHYTAPFPDVAGSSMCSAIMPWLGPALRVACKAVDGQVVPQQWLCNTTARRRPGRPASLGLGDLRSNAHGRGAVLRCDAGVAADPNWPVATQQCSTRRRVAERRKRAAYPEVSAGGLQRFPVLGSELGGCWNDAVQRLVRDLARVRSQRAPPALRAAATSASTRRWWAALVVAVQQAVTSTAFGSPPHSAMQGLLSFLLYVVRELVHKTPAEPIPSA